MQHAVFTYNATDWVLFFFIYSFLGWVFESTYVSLCKGRPVNRGFLRGPILPLYGSGAVLMLFVSIPVEYSLVLVYLAGCVAATALEYVTGVCMEAIFKVRYWDYSNKKFNFQGQICLSSTLAWGGLTILLVYGIHRPISEFVLALPVWFADILAHVTAMAAAADMALSFRAAMELRGMLIRMSDVRKELELAQKRADVILAFAEQDMREKREELGQRLAEARREGERLSGIRAEEARERRNELEEKLESAVLKLEETVRRLEEKRGRLGEHAAELEAVKQRLAAARERMQTVKDGLDFFGRGLLRGNPGATSRRYASELKELREKLEGKNEAVL